MREKLINICTPRQWKTLSTSELKDEGYTVYGANGVIGYYDEYNHKEETVVVTCRGATCGAVNISKPYSYINGNAMCMDDLRQDIDVKYLYYSLKKYDFKEVISGSAQPQITRQGLNNVFVKVVDKPRQLEIVKVLSNVEEIISRKQQQLSEYDQLIKSRFVEMFGDISINSKSFDIKPFSDLCFKIGDGLHGTPLYDDKGNYYFINGNNLGNDYIKITETTKKVNEEVFKKLYIQFSENTVFLSINGTLGNVALYNEEPIILGKSAAYCNLKPSLHIKFVAELFKTNKFKEYMLSNSSGTTITNFGLKAFRNYQMIVPPMILQTQFTKFVDQVDKLKFED